MRYAIRLKTGNLPTILDEDGNKISLTVGIGEEVHYEGVYYKGKVKVNLAGKWEKGFKNPLWVIGSLKPSELIGAYGLRGKIDESFRDMKNLLNLDKIMNKKQVNMEKMVALVALAYIIGFLIGVHSVYDAIRSWRNTLVKSCGKMWYNREVQASKARVVLGVPSTRLVGWAW
jgi:hypothetical protein